MDQTSSGKSNNYLFPQCSADLYLIIALVFVGPLSPGAALIVQSCGTNTSVNNQDSALSQGKL